ncbi:MAG: carbohydrate porin [Deltaproteobacteria bacterium]
MTGSWGGFRDRLIEWGVRPTATYDTTVLGNPTGGEKKGVKYAGLLNLYLDLDLERLLDVGGTRFMVSGSWASGGSLSEEDIGNFFPVSNIFSGRSVRLYQLFLETKFWDKRVTVAAGRLGVADYFSTAEVFGNYVSDAFNMHPVGIDINVPAYFANPEASWGSRMKIKPADDFYLASGAYNSNPRVGRDSTHGLDFSFRNGVILIAEAGYMPNSEEGSGGLRGGYKLGAYYDTGKFEELANTEKSRRGNYGFYVVIDQMLYREPETESEGFTAWATVTLAPEEEINTIPFFLSWGFVYEGLFPGRDEDNAAFGMAYGAVSNDLEGKDFEIALEGTYIFQISRWLDIQPDVQYIVHPGGSGSIPNALVVGVMLSVDL